MRKLQKSGCFQQEHAGRESPLSALPVPGDQAGVHLGVPESILPQGLHAEQTLVRLQTHVLQGDAHVYDRPGQSLF